MLRGSLQLKLFLIALSSALIALIVAVYTGKDKLAATLVWATAGLFVALALYIGAGGAGEREISAIS